MHFFRAKNRLWTRDDIARLVGKLALQAGDRKFRQRGGLIVRKTFAEPRNRTGFLGNRSVTCCQSCQKDKKGQY